jgi:predicted lipoprotein with Yx(FWY)xxD motif
MRRPSKAVSPRFLPPPGGSLLRATSPGLASAASAWLRRVFAVPAAVAMLTFALVTVVPQLSSPLSAQTPSTPSCVTPLTSAPSGPATVSASSTAFGRVLVVGSGDQAGCSLYALTSDQLHALSSGADQFACSDNTNALGASCDTVLWPALLTTGAPVAGPGVNPTLLGTVTRSDVLSGQSVQQVTYAGLPLYKFFLDEAPGQTDGANLFDPVPFYTGTWYLVEPSRGLPAQGQALIGQETALVDQTGTSATVLAASADTGFGGANFPVYTFSSDSGHSSACQGTCAVFWPPVLTSMRPLAGPGVDRHGLGTIVRPHGGHKVTFDGHPLYMFVRDADLPVSLFGSIPGVNQTASINGARVKAFMGVFQTVPAL